MKKLGIISDCIHFDTPSGGVATEIHILLYQLEALSAYFSEVVIACPFTTYHPAKVYTSYTRKHIRFIPLPVAGGDSLKYKWKLLSVIPKWIKAYRQLNRSTDIIYMRLPDNVSLPAFFYFLFRKKKTFITYTGTWADYKEEALTWRLEKWLLKNVFKGPYWVYAHQDLTAGNRHFGFSPSYTLQTWNDQATLVERKKQQFISGKSFLCFITVGKWVPHKNQSAIIEACRILKNQQQRFSLLIVGEGPLASLYQNKIKDYGLENEITLAGRKTREELVELYKKSDFTVQAPYQEPYGKVPVEGLFFGLLPVLSQVGVSVSMTGNGRHGFLFAPGDVSGLATILLSLYTHQHRFADMIESGRQFALHNTLEHWAAEYNKIITHQYT